MKYWQETETAHATATAMQMHVNMVFFQSELGMIAGRPSFSWRPTQNMKAGMRATAVQSSVRFAGSRSFDVLPVTALRGVLVAYREGFD